MNRRKHSHRYCRFSFQKVFIVFFVFMFFFSQVVPTSFAQTTLSSQERVIQYQPETAVTESTPNIPTFPRATQLPAVGTNEFLQGQSPLSRAANTSAENPASTPTSKRPPATVPGPCWRNTWANWADGSLIRASVRRMGAEPLSPKDLAPPCPTPSSISPMPPRRN